MACTFGGFHGEGESLGEVRPDPRVLVPRIAAQLNGQYLKLAKFKGEFVWHQHENEDELFLVTKGSLTIQFRDGDVVLGEGEFIVVPAGVDHRPVAAKEVQAILLEPISTLNTGNVRNERTIADLEWI